MLAGFIRRRCRFASVMINVAISLTVIPRAAAIAVDSIHFAIFLIMRTAWRSVSVFRPSVVAILIKMGAASIISPLRSVNTPAAAPALRMTADPLDMV